MIGEERKLGVSGGGGQVALTHLGEGGGGAQKRHKYSHGGALDGHISLAFSKKEEAGDRSRCACVAAIALCVLTQTRRATSRKREQVLSCCIRRNLGVNFFFFFEASSSLTSLPRKNRKNTATCD